MHRHPQVAVLASTPSGVTMSISCWQIMCINTHPNDVSNYMVVLDCQAIFYRSNSRISVNLCYLGKSINLSMSLQKNNYSTYCGGDDVLSNNSPCFKWSALLIPVLEHGNKGFARFRSEFRVKHQLLGELRIVVVIVP